MSETKDKAATAPLLSDDVMFSDISPANKYAHGVVCSWVRDWYEAKIASGELMVAKTVTGRKVQFGMWQCENCEYHGWTALSKFCPGCGAKIIEG